MILTSGLSRKKLSNPEELKNHSKLKYSNLSSDIGDEYVIVGKGVDWPQQNLHQDINWL